MSGSVLELRELSVVYGTERGALHAVERVSLDVQPGMRLGIVGESGCGKSTLMRAVLRLLPPNGRIVSGQVLFKGRNVATMTEHEFRKLRWKELALIPQSAMNALDPVYTVGDQVAEAIRVHTRASRSVAYEQVRELFRIVGIDERRMRAYPHQLSGGMRQRVMIAMALALGPSLIVADEPTTALDVLVQKRIITRLVDLVKERNGAMILVTHDMGVVAEVATHVAIMYAGRVAEYGDLRDIYKQPYHPYTLGLLNAFPSLEDGARDLVSIPGAPPDLVEPPRGCRFAPRCPFRAQDPCLHREPETQQVGPGHYVACHFTEKHLEFRRTASVPDTWKVRVNGVIG
ncbi:MAG: ABC transporter ATP-binding protein [Bacillota bacterium]|nr:ABC transporter ATP-binding protein [Bacillota bacterium]